MLHFIYRDSLTEDVELETSSSSPVSLVSDSLTAKLLAAADRYGLERLRVMCESHLCKDISVKSVAEILALAERYNGSDLKAVCLRFTAENLAGIFSISIGDCPFNSHFTDLRVNLQILQMDLKKQHTNNLCQCIEYLSIPQIQSRKL